MSEQVQSFNPILIFVWILQLIILAMDYSQDKKVTWAIPVIGSFLLIQLYMVWKTNYDAMVQEQYNAQTKKLSGNMVENTPIIQPGVTNLQNLNTKSDKNQPSPQMINLNLAPSVSDEEE